MNQSAPARAGAFNNQLNGLLLQAVAHPSISLYMVSVVDEGILWLGTTTQRWRRSPCNIYNLEGCRV